MIHGLYRTGWQKLFVSQSRIQKINKDLYSNTVHKKGHKHMKNKYDIVYSIGHDCACSMYLKKHNLRVVSGPLDWLTSVPAHMRFNLILNGNSGLKYIPIYYPH